MLQQENSKQLAGKNISKKIFNLIFSGSEII